tara:strand:+ start:249 stop:695 length:447 start_codon:yes stop_codon:yes gene_type:complete
MARKKRLTKRLESIIIDFLADGLTIRQIFDKPGGKLAQNNIEYTWTSFRKELLSSPELLSKYTASKSIAIDLELSNLKDKRLALEAKIESGEIDGKQGQNMVNLLKVIIAHSQWSASKLKSKVYGKSADVLTLKGSDSEPINISWTSK